MLRLSGHGEHDDAHYVTDTQKRSKTGADCIKVAEQYILDERLATAADLEKWRAHAVQQVEETVATVQREPAPDPDADNWCALATPRLADGFDSGCK